MFTVSYLQWYSQWRVFLCYNRRWLGLASMWPRYSCSDHLYLVNGLTVKNSAKYSAFVSNFDGNCIVYWIAVHSSELQQKIEHSAVVLKVVMCTVLCTAVVWFGYIWNIVALGKYMCQSHNNMNMYYRDLPTRTSWCFWCGESIPAFVYPMLGGGQHAGGDQMKLIGKPNYHLTEHPATPFLVYTHFEDESSCKLHWS